MMIMIMFIFTQFISYDSWCFLCVCVIQLGKLLETDEYQRRIVPCVVKLFSSTDRSTRVKLLQQVRKKERNTHNDYSIEVINGTISQLPKIAKG